MKSKIALLITTLVLFGAMTACNSEVYSGEVIKVYDDGTIIVQYRTNGLGAPVTGTLSAEGFDDYIEVGDRVWHTSDDKIQKVAHQTNSTSGPVVSGEG